MLKRPPEILITTPESLFLMLTSQARAILETVRFVILDEVHAVAGTKRGAHLALSLERLVRLAGRAVQRIGLSATSVRSRRSAGSSPGGGRSRSSTPASASELDLEVVVPLDDMREPGGEGSSIWPSIYPALLELVEAHRSTIVFVNNRRLAERLALRLNELAEKHGRARASRLAGPRAAGRDRGAPQAGRDPVPRRDLVARARDRHGRASTSSSRSSRRSRSRAGCSGSAAPATRSTRSRRGASSRSSGPTCSRARSSPGSCRRGRSRRRGSRAIRSTCSPSRSSRSRRRRRSRSTSCTSSSAAPGTSATSLAARSRTSSTCSPAGTRPRSSPSCGRASCWDRVAGVVRGATGRAPARGHERRDDPRPGALRRLPRRGRRAGRRARRGDGLRGARGPDVPARRDDLADRGHHARPRARLAGARDPRRGAVLEGGGHRAAVRARARRSGARRGSSSRLADEQALDRLTARARARRARRAEPRHLPPRAGAGDRASLPSDRTVVVERFRDEIGDWRLCILTPFGGRVHAPWALALAARLRESLGLEVNAIWSDDGIALHLPDADSPPPTDDVLVDAGASSRSSSCRSSAAPRSSARASARTPPARSSSRAAGRASARRSGSSG